MATKTLYIKDRTLWQFAADYARSTNTSVSALIELALDEYLARNVPVDYVHQTLVDTLVASGRFTPEQADALARKILTEE